VVKINIVIMSGVKINVFKSSETSHVEYDHKAKKTDLADKTCFESGRKCHLHVRQRRQL